MRLKLILFLFMLLYLLPSIDALESLQTGQDNLIIVSSVPDVVDQNISRYWYIQVYNSTSFLTSDVTCYLDIYNEYSNGSLIYRNDTLEYSGTSIPVHVPYDKFTDKGTYSFRAYCNTSTLGGAYLKNFYVTKGGEYPAEDNLKIFLFTMFIIGIIGLFYMFFIILFKFMQLRVTLLDVLISLASYILIVILITFSENYLLFTFIEDISIFALKLTMWTNGVFPFLAFMVSFFFTLLKKKKNPNLYGFRGGGDES